MDACTLPTKPTLVLVFVNPVDKLYVDEFHAFFSISASHYPCMISVPLSTLFDTQVKIVG